PASDSSRGTARVGIALGRMAQGRLHEGLAQLDSAAAELGSAEMLLQQAEWRAILPALGLRGWSGKELQPWMDRLEDGMADPAPGARARWASALGRLGSGDTAGFLRVTARPASSAPLDALARAIRAGLLGRPEDALAISDSVRHAFEVTVPPDPFAGAVFHLFRGTWERSLGSPQAADREWLWYQASDFEGWPSAHPQSGEVDGVLGGTPAGSGPSSGSTPPPARPTPRQPASCCAGWRSCGAGPTRRWPRLGRPSRPGLAGAGDDRMPDAGTARAHARRRAAAARAELAQAFGAHRLPGPVAARPHARPPRRPAVGRPARELGSPLAQRRAPCRAPPRRRRQRRVGRRHGAPGPGHGPPRRRRAGVTRGTRRVGRG